MKSPLLVIFLTVTLDLIGFGMVVPMLPLYAQQFGASGTDVALLLASYSLMQFVFAPFWGQLSDRLGRRPVLLLSIAGNALALLLFGLAQSFALLLVGRLLAGLFAANISVANAYVADVTTPANRARGMGLVGAAFGIGFVIGPFLGGELSQLGYEVPALIAAGLSAINVLAATVFLPESLPPELRAQTAGNPWRERLTVLRRGQFPGVVLALIFLQIFGFSMMEMALTLFAKLRLDLNAAQSGRLFAFVGIVLVVVQGGLIGRLSRRFGEVRLVQLGLALIAAGLAGLPWAPDAGWGVLLGAMALLGAGQGLCSPSLSSLLSQSASARQQGGVLGLSQSVSSLARVVGPQVAGVAFDRGGASAPFIWGALLMGGAWLLSLVRLRRPLTSPE